jgi:hypothetical protein
MTDERRRDQSKFDRGAAGPNGMPSPAAPPPPAVPTRPMPSGPVWTGSQSAELTQSAPPAPAEVDDESEYDDDAAEESLTFVERLRRLPPAPVLLTVGSIGSLVFLLLALTSHTTPVAVLLSAAVVTGLIFGVDAVIASVITWRASQGGEVGRAFLAAVVGGVASLVSLGAFAVTLVMLLVLNS